MTVPSDRLASPEPNKHRCFKCGNECEDAELAAILGADALCDTCFGELDRKFAPIAEWLAKPETQAAIEAEMASEE